MYRLSIFDLDGTLADTIDSMAYCANLALKELGLKEHPAECFRYFAGDGVKELVRRCLAASGDAEYRHFEELLARYRMYFSEHCMYRVKLYEGIPETLEALKVRGMKIAVLSNKPHNQAVAVVNSLFGAGYFDHIQGQQDGIPRKPDPAGALSMANYFAVRPEECLYIGDTNTDMQTGNAAGMHSIGVLWGFRDRMELEENHADTIIDYPEELLEFV